VDTEKEELAAWRFFSSLPTHLARPEKTFYLCPSKKKELPGTTMTLEEF
jgi:hypothetical protein